MFGKNINLLKFIMAFFVMLFFTFEAHSQTAISCGGGCNITTSGSYVLNANTTLVTTPNTNFVK